MNSMSLTVMALSCALTCGAAGNDPARWVDPYVGTCCGGNAFPGPSCPFGLAQPSPDTNRDVPKWRTPSGFRFEDPYVYGFSQTHLNGVGCDDLGDIRLFPITGAEPRPAAKDRPKGALRDDAYRSAYAKSNTVAEAGYYAVKLDNGAFAELTAAPHAAFDRFSWPEGCEAKLLLDLQWGMAVDERRLRDHLDPAIVKLEPERRRILGRNSGWQWVYRQVYYAIEFSHPWKSVETLKPLEFEQAPRMILAFDLKPGERLGVKIGLSTVSSESAAANLAAEIPGWDFGKVRRDCRAAWNELLSRAEIEGTDDQKRVFYTALYHLLLQPSNIADLDGRYRGLPKPGAKFRDKPVFTSPSGTFYSTFSLWDTYRAAAPYLTIFAPERVGPMLNSLLDQYDACGYLPIWPLWGGETGCMIANHAVPVLADACLKGIPGVDWERAYAACRDTLTKKRCGHMNTDWEVYAKYGYFPNDAARDTVSLTLEACGDDEHLARMAEKLGHGEDAAFFRTRARNWRNLWDPSTGFFRGKGTNGVFRADFRVLDQGWYGSKVGVDFCEANAWQYLFHMMQDPEGLIGVCGGRTRFLARLDEFFGKTRELDGTVGEPRNWIGLGQYEQPNEPSHHIPYFYAVAGRPARTQEIVRRVCEKLYVPKPFGLPGNDDCGQTSAWYLFSAMGFYPFDPCGGVYVLGAPQLPRVEVKVRGEGERRTFRVLAKGLSKENKYVKSVTLNGKPVTDWRIRHADIMKGGELVFEMCPDSRDEASPVVAVCIGMW